MVEICEDEDTGRLGADVRSADWTALLLGHRVNPWNIQETLPEVFTHHPAHWIQVLQSLPQVCKRSTQHAHCCYTNDEQVALRSCPACRGTGLMVTGSFWHVLFYCVSSCVFSSLLILCLFCFLHLVIVFVLYSSLPWLFGLCLTCRFSVCQPSLCRVCICVMLGYFLFRQSFILYALFLLLLALVLSL